METILENEAWTQRIYDDVDRLAADYIALADDIWGYAELGYAEYQSSAAHKKLLEKQGFRVTSGVGKIETAFIAESAAAEGPIIGLLGEFDALSGLNQKSMGLARASEPNSSSHNGHGCGHHLLGVAAHLAAVAVTREIERSKLKGSVRFYGCPAEEGGWGKSFMVKEGVFDDLSAALTWHPGMVNAVYSIDTLAVIQAYFTFEGKSAHAGVSPHLGRSALDALELMNVGVNFLREHVIDEARIHYAITDAGGTSPNVVQPRAQALYMIRAPQNLDVKQIFERIVRIAEGAALMTDCSIRMDLHSACSNLLTNATLNNALHEALVDVPEEVFTTSETQYGQQIQDTVGADELETARRRFPALRCCPGALFSDVLQLTERPQRLHGSTDVGDVSWVTPTAQIMTACYAVGTAAHSWQWVAQGKSSVAHKGMLRAAKALATTAITLLKDPAKLQAANDEHRRSLAERPYQNPIPDGIDPPKANA